MQAAEPAFQHMRANSSSTASFIDNVQGDEMDSMHMLCIYATGLSFQSSTKSVVSH